MSPASEHRAGFVALGGRTNTGKSTLLNRIVGRKVAIVTPRAQTTRGRIVGIRTDPDAQIILIDAPGLHEARSELNRRMVQTARRVLSEGELILALAEAGDRLRADDRAAIAEILAAGRPAIIVINKIDKVPRPKLLPLIEEVSREFPGIDIVPVSALSGENVDRLVAAIKEKLPVGPPLMPEDEYTDQAERAIAAEIIREKIFLRMREEIPFSTAVRVESFEDDAQRNLKSIRASVIVDRESHKGMLIGAGGRMLKEIGTTARLELQKIFGTRVYLEITVRAERGWTRDSRKLEEFGL